MRVSSGSGKPRTGTTRAGVLAALLGLACCVLGVGELRGYEPYRVGILKVAEPFTYTCTGCGPLIAVGQRAMWTVGPALMSSDAAEGVPGTLRDLKTGPYSADLNELTAAGDRLFFLGNDGHLGWQLWTSDGTAAGTDLVVDLREVQSYTTISQLTGAGSRVFFQRFAVNEGSLWVSDGSAAGTHKVTDASGFSPNPRVMVGTDDGLVMLANLPGQAGLAVWRADLAGTTVTQVVPLGPWLRAAGLLRFGSGIVIGTRGEAEGSSTSLVFVDLSSAAVTPLAVTQSATMPAEDGASAMAGGQLFFVLDTPAGRRLWRTNGTAAGTADVTPVGAVLSKPAWLAPLGTSVLMAAGDTAHGTELWRSDGTVTSGALVADLIPGPSGSTPTALTAHAGRVFLSAVGPATGRELWVSDGTRAGTGVVADLCPGSCSGLAETQFLDELPRRTIVSTPRALMLLATTGKERCRLWESDGTANGTVPRGHSSSFEWGRPPSNLGPLHVAVNGSVLVADPQHSDAELLHSRGEADDLAPLTPRLHLSLPSFPTNHAMLRGRLYFAIGSSFGEVWRTDGTPPGTARAFDGEMREPSAPMDGVFFFWRGETELRRSNGTEAGTRMVQRFPPRGMAWDVSRPAILGSRVLFAVDDGEHGRELWSSDGTPEGTSLLADLCPGSCSSFELGEPSRVVIANGHAVMRYPGAGEGSGLISTDGTAAGTTVLLPPSSTHWVGKPIGVADRVLFVTTSTNGDTSLWSSDGTAGTLSRLANLSDILIDPAYPENDIAPAVRLFAADDGTHGVELWRTDGTVIGTQLVRDISPGLLSSFPRAFVAAAGRTCFAASDGGHGTELWCSDGTAAGTAIEADVAPGPASSAPARFTTLGNRLLFEPGRASGNRELWALRISPLPQVQISDTWADELPSGPAWARVTVWLDEPAASQVSVRWTTVDGTARAGQDYLATTGTAIIPAASSGPVEITVPLLDDGAEEGTETFSIHLESATGAVIARDWAEVAISDDENPAHRPRRRLLAGGS